MALYHFSLSNISRGQGRSIVAAAAYRAAEKLVDERYGKTHDYRPKAGVAYTEILAPSIAPVWLTEREKLWNHIEAIEKRKDARLAREVQFALHRELTLEQNIALAREFVQKTFVDQGMVADIAVHIDKSADGELQPHAHVLLATRVVTEQGFGLKEPAWNKTELLCEWRAAWAELSNHHLAMHGHDLQVDHRSHAERGLNLEPQHKIGALAAQHLLARFDDHQRIARENGERLFNDPRIALQALTQQQSTFTLVDMAQFVNRHTVGAEQFQQVYARVQAASNLVPLGLDHQGQARWTTQEMLSLERQMLKDSHQLFQHIAHETSAAALTAAQSQRTLSLEQQSALTYLTAGGNLKCLIGYAGTGKSYLLGAAKEAWEASGYRVQGVALAGIAAQNLEHSSGISSRTVASQFYRWNSDRDRLTAQDILVVDEAGMLGSRQLAQIVAEAKQAQAKVVLIGDPQQLQAIEAGAAFRSVAKAHSYMELTEIRRQQVDWQREATMALAHGQVEQAINHYADHDHIHHHNDQATAKAQLIAQWQDVRHTHPEQTQIILAYTRRDVAELNQAVRGLRQAEGELGPDHKVMTERGEREFAVGDRIYFLKRHDHLQVVNGTLGTVQAIDSDGQFKIALDQNDLNAEKRLVTVDPQKYNHLEHGYAATVYKAQGVTVDRTYLLASAHYDAHSSYVGLSRHRLSCDMFVSREVFQDDQALIRTLSRQRHKDVSVDYDNSQTIQQFGEERGVDFKLPTVELKASYLAQQIERRRPELEVKGQQLVNNFRRRQRQADEQEIKAIVKAFDAKYPERAAAHAEFLQPKLVKDIKILPQQLEKQQQQEHNRLTEKEPEYDRGLGFGW